MAQGVDQQVTQHLRYTIGISLNRREIIRELLDLRAKLQAEELHVSFRVERTLTIDASRDGADYESLSLSPGREPSLSVRQRVGLRIPEFGRIEVGRGEKDRDLEDVAGRYASLESLYRDAVSSWGEDPDSAEALDQLVERRAKRAVHEKQLARERDRFLQLAPQGISALHSELERIKKAHGAVIDRRARGLSPGSVEFYQQKLTLLQRFLGAEGVGHVYAITPDLVRHCLLQLGRTHNPGGVHAAHRAMRAFLLWWESEWEPNGWKNPLRNVRSPRVPTEPLEPVPTDHVKAMIRTCRRRAFFGDRDRAVLLCLLDTGCRAGEFAAINIGDVDLATGQILIRAGKGGKPRMVFVGSKSRRALAAYLRVRADVGDAAPLFAGITGRRLSYAGLRDIVRRRASKGWQGGRLKAAGSIARAAPWRQR